MADDQSISLVPASHDADFWRQVLDSLTAEVAVIDRQGRIVAINEAWRAFARDNGGSPEKTGVGADYLGVCRGEDDGEIPYHTQARQGIEQVLQGELEVFEMEYPCHSATQQRWFLLHVSPVTADDRYLVTTHMPITDRKRTEQRLLVAERLAAIGQAMQGLSHEGRNALQRSQACIDLLREHVAEDAEAMNLLERIEGAQHHLLGLYEEVKSYAAPITLRRQVYALDGLVEEVWAGIAPRNETARFSNVRSGRNWNCVMDVKEIGRALRLLFDNALSCGAPSPVIQVSYCENRLHRSPAVTVIVSDNGPGVPRQHRERVFEPFFTTKMSGTGLGLAVCKRIVSAHGGDIYVGVPLLQGASVYITLPQHAKLPDAPR